MKKCSRAVWGGEVWRMISSSHKVKKKKKKEINVSKLFFPKPHDTVDLSAIVTTSHTVRLELGAAAF